MASGVDPRRDPSGRGRIVDILAANASATKALLSAAAERLRRDHACHVVAFDYLDPRPWARRACFAAGFLRRASVIQAVAAGTKRWSHPVADDPANWYLTRADTDLA